MWLRFIALVVDASERLKITHSNMLIPMVLHYGCFAEHAEIAGTLGQLLSQIIGGILNNCGKDRNNWTYRSVLFREKRGGKFIRYRVCGRPWFCEHQDVCHSAQTDVDDNQQVCACSYSLHGVFFKCKGTEQGWTHAHVLIEMPTNSYREETYHHQRLNWRCEIGVVGIILQKCAVDSISKFCPRSSRVALLNGNECGCQ